MRRTQAIPIMVGAALALGACGGGDESGDATADRRADNRDAALDFARCMRENGVPMPDPRTGENGGIVIDKGSDEQDAPRPAPATLRKAQEACNEHLERMQPPEMSEERQGEFREQALAHAKCMREQGIDFPDPQFSEDGGVRMEAGGRGDGLDPRSPRFREAMEVCREKTGGGPIVEAAPGAEGP